MTSKEYVLSKYPEAVAVPTRDREGRTGDVIFMAPGTGIVLGKKLGQKHAREAMAWADAARNIKAGKVPV